MRVLILIERVSTCYHVDGYLLNTFINNPNSFSLNPLEILPWLLLLFFFLPLLEKYRDEMNNPKRIKSRTKVILTILPKGNFYLKKNGGERRDDIRGI